MRTELVAGPYYDRYLRWLKGGLPRHEAYLERAGAHQKARAYLQARADARAAVEAVEALQRVWLATAASEGHGLCTPGSCVVPRVSARVCRGIWQAKSCWYSVEAQVVD